MEALMSAKPEPLIAERAQAEIRKLISGWAKAVRDEDLAGIRAHHDPDILMFDVPPPFQSRGLEAYMATWDTFYPSQARPIRFDFEQMQITAGSDVAFATAIGHCGYIERGETIDLKFRLTMGFQKKNDDWVIVHEHHSLPATDSSD
jgi:ketosteroid isomerase-like protein